MVSIYDVSPQALVNKAAEELKKVHAVKMPEWGQFVKSGSHAERIPARKDWWYVRAAAILRTVYIKGPIGVSKLRTKYGGKKSLGYKSEHFRRSGGKHIRLLLQQLGEAGFVKQDVRDGHKGRVITPQGRKFLDRAALSLMKKV